MKATALLLCFVLVSNPLVFAAKGPDLPQLDEPSMMNGQHDSLYGAWARYIKGMLIIQIPFFTGTPTWDEIAITLIGLQIIHSVKNQEQIGWMVYCDPNGNILWGGPITAFNATLWHWIFSYLPLRAGSIAPFQPLFTLLSPVALILTQLQQNLGNELPPGYLRISFDSNIVQRTGGETGVQLGYRRGSESHAATLWTGNKFRRFINFVAYGLAGTLLVTQLLVVSNLTNRPTSFDLLLYSSAGAFILSLAFTIAALQTKRISIGEETLRAMGSGTQDVPEFFFGTGRILASPDSELDVATIYQISDSGSPAVALSAAPAQNQNLLGEAGLAVSAPSNLNLVAVFRSSEADTGVAVGNPDLSETATLSMTLTDNSGTEVATAADIEIPPLGVISKFFWEYFSGTQIPTDFVGTLTVASDVGVQITALNTLNGFVQSSLPSSQPGP